MTTSNNVASFWHPYSIIRFRKFFSAEGLRCVMTFLFFCIVYNSSYGRTYTKDGITYIPGSIQVRQFINGMPDIFTLQSLDIQEIDWDCPEEIDLYTIPLPDVFPDYYLGVIAAKACKNNQIVKKFKRGFHPKCDKNYSYAQDSYSWGDFPIYIREQAFYNCRNLEIVDLSMRGHQNQRNISRAASLNIENEVFAKCTSLREVYLTVTSIGELAFSGCTSLEKIYLLNPGGGVPYVGRSAFDGVDVSKCILYVPAEDMALYQADAVWGQFIIQPLDEDYYGWEYVTEDGVVYKHHGRWWKTRTITSVTEECEPHTRINWFDNIVPSACKGNKTIQVFDCQCDYEDHTTTIGEYAFYGCPHLDSVLLAKPYTVKANKPKIEIEPYSFAECKSLKHVTLPHASKIGDFAFKGCSALESIYIYFRPGLDFSISENAFDGVSREKCKIYVDKMRVDEAKAHPVLGQFEVLDIQEALDGTPRELYDDKGRTVYAIDRWNDYREIVGFSDCDSINAYTMNHYNPFYEDDLYGYHTSYYELFYSQIYKIRERAAANHTQLQLVYLPLHGNYVNSLGQRIPVEVEREAFCNCTNLEEVIFVGDPRENYNSVGVDMNISSSVFASCGKLSKIHLNNVRSFGDYAFKDCTSLSDIYLFAEDINSIEVSDNAFEGVDCSKCNLYVLSSMAADARHHPVFGRFRVKTIPTDYFVNTLPNIWHPNCFYSPNEEIAITDDGASVSVIFGWPIKPEINLPASFNDLDIKLITGFNNNNYLRSFKMEPFSNSIYLNGFNQCKNLEYVDFATYVNLPPDETHNNASAKEQPGRVIINNNFLNDCPSLKEVKLPRVVFRYNVEYCSVFRNCKNLERVYLGFFYDNPISWNTNIHDFEGVDREKCVIYVPMDLLESAKAHPLLGQFTVLPIEYETDAIRQTEDTKPTVSARYDITGKKIDHPIPGINIVRMSNGSARKVWVK